MDAQRPLTWVPGLNDQQRCSKMRLRRNIKKKKLLCPIAHQINQFLLVDGPDLRHVSIFRQSESLALEEVPSSRRKLTDERARQTITGQVCPLYPPRAGQRKWRNL